VTGAENGWNRNISSKSITSKPEFYPRKMNNDWLFTEQFMETCHSVLEEMYEAFP
jgi:hypothetical protein